MPERRGQEGETTVLRTRRVMRITMMTSTMTMERMTM